MIFRLTALLLLSLSSLQSTSAEGHDGYCCGEIIPDTEMTVPVPVPDPVPEIPDTGISIIVLPEPEAEPGLGLFCGESTLDDCFHRVGFEGYALFHDEDLCNELCSIGPEPCFEMETKGGKKGKGLPPPTETRGRRRLRR